MKEDYQNQPTQDDGTAQTRRRVVKGLAGLPAMVTLASGSALANGSTFQCLADTENAQPDTDIPADGSYHACNSLLFEGSDILRQPQTNLAYVEVNNFYQPLYADQHGNLSLVSSVDNSPVNCSCIVSFTRHA